LTRRIDLISNELYCIQTTFGLTESEKNGLSTYKQLKTNTTEKQSYKPLTPAYAHWLAEVHFGSFAPAFTLSLCDSERSRKPPMPIASVVRRQYKKTKR